MATVGSAIVCDRLRSSAIIWKQVSLRSSAIVGDHMEAMSTQLDKCQLPCDSDDIRKMQKNAVEESMAVFQAETVGVSALSSEKYLEELVVRMKYLKSGNCWLL